MSKKVRKIANRSLRLSRIEPKTQVIIILSLCRTTSKAELRCVGQLWNLRLLVDKFLNFSYLYICQAWLNSRRSCLTADPLRQLSLF